MPPTVMAPTLPIQGRSGPQSLGSPLAGGSSSDSHTASLSSKGGPSQKASRQWADYTPQGPPGPQGWEAIKSPWSTRDGLGTFGLGHGMSLMTMPVEVHSSSADVDLMEQLPPPPKHIEVTTPTTRPELSDQSWMWPATPTPSHATGGMHFGFGPDIMQPAHLPTTVSLPLQPPPRIAALGAASAAAAAAGAGAAAGAAAAAALDDPLDHQMPRRVETPTNGGSLYAEAAYSSPTFRGSAAAHVELRSQAHDRVAMVQPTFYPRLGDKEEAISDVEEEDEDEEDDDESDEEVPPTSVPSRGSALHGTGKCRPCAWFWKPQKCQNDQDCGYCHLCPEGELKSRKKCKVQAMRMGALEPSKSGYETVGVARVLKLSPLI
mmetsp:Transcript_24543/g.54639  ORF Transcript_24543/g.54639 Transcript_24543/m.54639 type:complete len:377 (+) Transcript_24543:74-1204(+)